MSNPEIRATESGWAITPPSGKLLTLNNLAIKRYTETVTRAQFTDGGSTAGTYDLAHAIPTGAIFLFSVIRAVTGFTGDTSAVITIGDGSDVDRYNTGTPNVFATAANGVAAGIPSGTIQHTAQVTPKLTVTSAADFTNVAAGSVTIDLYYIIPR